jgi:phosphatidylserine decarboxylase
VVEGQHVTAGDEIGMFHYGGSSYCLLFQAGFQSSFIADRIRSQPQSTGNNTVKSLLAFLD